MKVRLEVMGQGSQGYAVRVPRSIANSLALRGRRSVTVRVGQRRVRASCTASSAKATIGLTPALLERLGLRRGMHLHARAGGDALHIGPLVGILVPGAQGLPNPIGNMTLGVSYFIQQARGAGVYAFAFTCSSMDLSRGLARGYTLSMGELGLRWVRRTFPLPDAVYDHITYRRRDRASDIRRLRQRLREAGIPYFNDGFFDKWEVHNWLSQCPDLLPHVPETRQLGVQALEEMCAAHRRVFIKPAQGSLGRNIYVLRRREGGGYDLSRAKRPGVRVPVPDLALLQGKLSRLGRDFYVVQQGLDLCTAHGRPVDVRVIMQRDGAGRWRVTKVFARIALRGRLVANLAAGAKAVPATNALRHSFSSAKVKAMVRSICQLARKVCDCVAEAAEGHVGELGVDIGVDKTGHAWIIEVNSKPHRKAYDTLEGRPGAKRSFLRPMQYAGYLAGFRI